MAVYGSIEAITFKTPCFRKCHNKSGPGYRLANRLPTSTNCAPTRPKGLIGHRWCVPADTVTKLLQTSPMRTRKWSIWPLRTARNVSLRLDQGCMCWLDAWGKPWKTHMFSNSYQNRRLYGHKTRASQQTLYQINIAKKSFLSNRVTLIRHPWLDPCSSGHLSPGLICIGRPCLQSSPRRCACNDLPILLLRIARWIQMPAAVRTERGVPCFYYI